MPLRVTQRTLLLLAALACSQPKQPFVLPRSPEDVRGRLLTVLEGHPIAEARALLADHGVRCEAPIPSATDAHAHVCHPPERKWALVLIERNGRVADVQSSY